MPTWRLDLNTDGTSYRGWQIQHNAKTIQGELEKAVRSLFESKFELYGSGRTDAGVHAVGQVARSCKGTANESVATTNSSSVE